MATASLPHLFSSQTRPQKRSIPAVLQSLKSEVRHQLVASKANFESRGYREAV